MQRTVASASTSTSHSEWPAQHTRGVCVWLTGLSGAGKSTLAQGLARIVTARGRSAVVFDGDELRARIRADLGFSRADREQNARMAAELARAAVADGLVAICALISPYRDARRRAREIVGWDRFLEVYVDTPLVVCEARDPKGLYRRARQRAVQGVTGIDDPYEPPDEPALRINGGEEDVPQSVERLTALLIGTGFLERATQPPEAAPPSLVTRRQASD